MQPDSPLWAPVLLAFILAGYPLSGARAAAFCAALPLPVYVYAWAANALALVHLLAYLHPTVFVELLWILEGAWEHPALI